MHCTRNKVDAVQRQESSPPGIRPANPQRVGHRGVLSIGVDFRLHPHELRENLRVSGIFELAILASS